MPSLEIWVFLGLLCICVGTTIAIGMISMRRMRDQRSSGSIPARPDEQAAASQRYERREGKANCEKRLEAEKRADL